MKERTWTTNSKNEARMNLVNAIEFAKAHNKKPAIQAHAAAWLCRAMIEMNKTAALKYIEDAWRNGQECIDDYEWIESGTISCKINAVIYEHTNKAYIFVDVSADVTRIAIDQARFDAAEAARREAWREHKHLEIEE